MEGCWVPSGKLASTTRLCLYLVFIWLIMAEQWSSSAFQSCGGRTSSRRRGAAESQTGSSFPEADSILSEACPVVLQRQVRSRSASFRPRPLPTSPAPHEQQVKERTPRQGTCRHGDPLRVALLPLSSRAAGPSNPVAEQQEKMWLFALCPQPASSFCLLQPGCESVVCESVVSSGAISGGGASLSVTSLPSVFLYRASFCVCFVCAPARACTRVSVSSHKHVNDSKADCRGNSTNTTDKK